MVTGVEFSTLERTGDFGKESYGEVCARLERRICASVL